MDENSPDENPQPDEIFMEGTAQALIDGLLDKNTVHAVGVGGCGCNTIEYLKETDLENIKTIGINTDESILEDRNIDRQMLIGKEITNGKGANGNPDIGKRAAELNEKQILKAIDDADFVVVVAGLGGGTGSGASQVIADLARRNGKMVVTYAVMPFSAEKERFERAQSHLDQLSDMSQATTVFENDETLLHENKSPKDGFELTGKMLYEVVKCLKMEYINEFFHEIGIDLSGMSENFSSLMNQTGESEVEREAEEPPVLEAMKYVEDNDSFEEESEMDSFLKPY